jgi:hypothetical protein
MYTTTSFTNNKPIIIDSKHDNSKSVFNSSVPYSPLDQFNNNPGTSSMGAGMEFKNELMERIKYEAKRLNKRGQMNLSCITTTSSIVPESTLITNKNDNTNNNNTSSNSSSSSNCSDDDDQENNTKNHLTFSYSTSKTTMKKNALFFI